MLRYRPFAVSFGMAVTTVLAAQDLRFDVASVKRSERPASGVVVNSPGRLQLGGRWIASFATLKQLVDTAYPGHAMPGQLIGGPDWLARDRFDIVATTSPERSPDEVGTMVRALLAERFQLSVHTERQEMPVFALVFSRNDRKLGEGMKRPAIDCEEYREARKRGEAVPLGLVKPGDPPPCVAVVRPSATSTRVTAGGTTVEGILGLLSAHVGRPVIDRTGLKEQFDIDLQFGERAYSTETRDASVANASSIFDAIQRQLGLRLQSGRGPVEVLVIDSASPPSAN